MTIEKILEIFPFLDSNDTLQRDQLSSYADWVITGLDYNNICHILEYLKQYDVGDISDFFLYELGVFLFPFQERFKPLWEQLIRELGDDYTTKIIEGECSVYDEFARIEKELFGKK